MNIDLFPVFWILWGVALVIVVVIFGVLIFRWRRAAQSPYLIHTLLPPYDIPDVILVGGVIIENRGGASALNVKVEINYEAESAKIQHIHVESEEPYILRGGGEQYNFATIRLGTFGPSKKIFVYWASGAKFQPRVSVTSFQSRSA